MSLTPEIAPPLASALHEGRFIDACNIQALADYPADGGIYAFR